MKYINILNINTKLDLILIGKLIDSLLIPIGKFTLATSGSKIEQQINNCTNKIAENWN